MSSGLMQPLIVVGVWVLGLIVIYEWGTRPKSSLLKLDGGQTKTYGNVFAVIGFFSAAMGVLLGILWHDWLVFMCAGIAIGTFASRIITRRIAAKRGLTAVEPDEVLSDWTTEGRGRVARRLWLIYATGCVAVVSGAVAAYACNLRGWLLLLATGVALAVVSGFVWARWLQLKRKNER